MPRTPLKALREAAHLTQAELAASAGVSRQLVGAVEGGRHLPRVDTALALAAALGVDVEALFGFGSVPADVATGSPPSDGALVRVGRVGERTVTAAARVGPDGWDVADGVVEQGTLTLFGRGGPGLVVAGCEPGLEVLERLLREQAMAAVAASASSTAAAAALAAGRVHAAVVHGPERDAFPAVPGVAVDRYLLARWRVGLAAPSDFESGWWRTAVSGRVPVVQREPGAGVQQAFERAVGTGVSIPGPRVGNHLEAARRAVFGGMPAVTIEPAALAVGASFHPIEIHEAQLWVARAWLSDRCVTTALDVIASRRFQRRLDGVGGYDLDGCGGTVG